ncbi:hypothetical protein [Streptomyces rubellomurinus]|uniref:Uncharacterized protein n=1 Tax=Streptomyces sp. Y1 TaxID=3238634 RepID=A0AB39TYH2_9ACTN|nr:hypothetical protein VM98_23385 [Streptomyces rubellomurinus subsp. indigoferus]
MSDWEIPAAEAQARPVSPAETVEISRSVSQLDLFIDPAYRPAEPPCTLCSTAEAVPDAGAAVCAGCCVGAGAVTCWVSAEGVNGSGPGSVGACSATSLAVGMAS